MKIQFSSLSKIIYIQVNSEAESTEQGFFYIYTLYIVYIILNIYISRKSLGQMLNRVPLSLYITDTAAKKVDFTV
jgi:hypothetical protein